MIVELQNQARESGTLASQVQQAAKRTNVRAYLIRRNISFIAVLPIEKQCFHHFLAVWITNGFQRRAPAQGRDLLVDPAFDLLLHGGLHELSRLPALRRFHCRSPLHFVTQRNDISVANSGFKMP
jgi:hypothetical protein